MDVTDHITPLKILMTTDTVGGVWTYTTDLCRSLSEHHVYIHLVTMGATMKDWQKKEIDLLDNVTVYETNYQLEWMEDPWENIEYSGAYLLSIQEAVLADIVHLNGYVHGALDWDVPVVMVAHSDVYSWWRSVKKGSPPDEWSTYYKKVKKGLSEANHIVAPSHAMMAELNEIYALSKNHSILYNSRIADHFYTGNKEKTVMCMGRIWDEAKNVQLLIQAADRIHYPVKIAGDNQFYGNKVDVTQSNVRSLGKLDSLGIAAELSTASIYVLPAKYEPFGLSVLEAALSGCALVLGDIPSLREIWQDNAIYVDTDDDIALAKVINNLMGNESQLADMASKAWKHAQRFNTAKMANQYMNLYRQLLQHYTQPLPKKLV